MFNITDEIDKLQDRLAALSSESKPSTSNQQVSNVIPDMQLFFEQYDGEEPFENFADRLEAHLKIRNISPKLYTESLILSLKPGLHTILKHSLFPRRCAELPYEELKCKLNDILKPKKGIIPSRFKFLNRKQRKGESIDDYIAELRKLIVDCKYPNDIVEVMLRDVFIAGIWSHTIKNKLLEKDDISLDTTLHIATSLEELATADAQSDSQQKSKRKNYDSKKSHHNRDDRSKKWSKDSEAEKSAACMKTGWKLPARISPNGSSELPHSKISVDPFGMAFSSTITLNGKTHASCSRSESSELPFTGSRTDKFFVGFPGAQVQTPCTVILEWSGNKEVTDHAILKILSNVEGTEGSVLLTLDLCEVICVLNSSAPGQPCVSLPTVKNIESDVSPLRLYHQSATDMVNWLSCCSKIWQRAHKIPPIPRERSIWCTIEQGSTYVSDVDSLQKTQNTMNGRYMKEYSTKNHSYPFRMPLLNGFTYHTEVTINGTIHANANRFHVNLVCGHNEEIALHFNPRFKDQVIVRNSLIGGEWGPEEREGGFDVAEKKDFTLTIICMEKKFKIILNGKFFGNYNHRVSPDCITDIEFDGNVDIHDVLYESDKVILDVKDLLWRKVADNLQLVETCPVGVTWGIPTSGNPLVFVGLPKESWNWVSVERGRTTLKDVSLSVLDGSVHPKTISVWAINENGKVLFRCGVTTANPSGEKWEQVQTDQSVRSISCGGMRQVWCCGESGTCFWKPGITAGNPIGESWRFVKSLNGCTFTKVAVGKWTVWVMDNKGDLYIRKDITPSNPGGVAWIRVSNNRNNKFKHIHISNENVWAITKDGVVCRRIGITPNNPEGVSWNYGLSGNWHHISE